MSEELNNININDNNDSNSTNGEIQNENTTTNTNVDIPIVTYVSEAPKTSSPVSTLSKEIKSAGEANSISSDPLEKYRQIVQREHSSAYRWNCLDESNGTANNKSNEKKSNKKKNKNLGLKIFSAAMSAMFLFSFASTVYMFSLRNGGSNRNDGETPVISNDNSVPDDVNSVLENTGITINDNKSAQTLTTAEVIAKVKPSVVCIEVSADVQMSDFFGRNSSYTAQSIGTGFILTEDGYIATNYHVIEGAKELKVTLNSGETYTAEIIGGDPAADIAVIKVDAKNLPVAELGKSDMLVQGDDVVAIGTPAGAEFAGTATKGIVSAINRDVDVSSGYGSSSKKMTVIQTDASINPGNSGGPLVNDKGQVIGINTMKLSSSSFEGMGFAIPINTAIPVINDIIENPGVREDTSSSSAAEDTSNVSFGIGGATVSEAESQYYGIPQGFKISQITEGGPCDNTGIQLSDIIVALNGKDVMSYEDLIEMKKDFKPGDKVTLTVYRNGDTYDFEIILAARQ